MSLRDVWEDPKRMAAVHAWLALLWLVLAVATTAWALYDSENKFLLAWIVAMSGYANAAGHLSAHQGAAPSAKE